MATIFLLPTWTTFNKIPADAPADGLAALNFALGLTGTDNELVIASENPVWKDLQDLDLGGGPLTRGGSAEAMAQVTPISNASFLTVDQCGLAVAVGGDVQGFPCFVEIPVANLGDEVPATFPNRSYTVLADPDDPDSGVETVHTWETWEPHHKLSVEILGNKYKALATSVKYLDASQWVGQGLSVKTEPEYKKLMADNPAPVEE